MKKKFFITVVFFAAFGALVFFNKSFFADKLSYILRYPQIIVSKTMEVVRNPFVLLFEMKFAKEENEELRLENFHLLSEVSRLKEYEKENRFLRQEFGNKFLADYNLIITDIVGIAPYFSGGYLFINKGKEDGISENMPVVVNDRILIGKVSAANSKTSKVATIMSDKNKVAAITQETEISGILSYEDNYLIMEILDGVNFPKTGEIVATSGLDGFYPSGFLLGKVKARIVSDQEASKKVIIEPFFRLASLRKIFVISNFIIDIAQE